MEKVRRMKHYAMEQLARSGIREIRITVGRLEFGLGLADGRFTDGVEAGEA